ncbi:MAG: F0F1 ATP synthase subunit delta, partial [Actinobacteria bacterium]|nr:F0F1 ATP synthase subunit delta [Actinomycetota bacterium]
MIILGGSSRQSLALLRVDLDEKLKNLTSADCATLSNELFHIWSSLDSSIGLRRALTDPARDATSKSELIANLFGKVLSAKALEIFSKAVSLRWSNPAQLADAIEQIAVEAEAAVANVDDKLDLVLSEIFNFSKIILENPELRLALINRADSVERKQELLKSIFGQKFTSSSQRLLSKSVEGRGNRGIEKSISAYSNALTARRNRVNAHIKSSIALSDGQAKKLADSLTMKIGQPVHLNIEIDPSVLGGISIRF